MEGAHQLPHLYSQVLGTTTVAVHMAMELVEVVGVSEVVVMRRVVLEELLAVEVEAGAVLVLVVD